MRFQTRAVRAGQKPDSRTGAVVPPLYQNVTFEMDAPGAARGYDYLRTGNPTRSALEEALASLEGARHAVCFSSGMAAVAAVASLLSPGDHLISSLHLYAGTHRFFTKMLQKTGIEVTFVETEQPENVRQALREDTRLIWIETPSNPLGTLTDIAAVAAIAREADTPPLVVVDSTMASPFCQQPLALGADIVLHSTTKYISGHLDVLGGALATNDDELHQALYDYQNACGPTPSPFDNWLTLRGIRTLGIRMKAHQENALAIARVLEDHPAVAMVSYPGLESFPQRELALRQMTGFSGMVCAELKGGLAAVQAFTSRLELFTLAESLGGAQSLISHSATMTHASLSPEDRAAQGITEGLVRLSVGLEDPEDLVEDIRQALDSLQPYL